MKRDVPYSSYWNASVVFMLLLLALCCYWPITSGIFSAKNDNITQFLPVRFHVSEALRNGHLPLWTPYIYLGFPMHGDMQGGAWNPVVWILSIPGRYNLTSLHSEVLIYIFFSGLGMYRLLAAYNHPKNICLAGAGAYLMCGYISDVAGSNLPFLAAAAYTPFVFAYYYHLLKSPTYQYAFKTAVFLSLLLVSAYPSFFICTFYVLLAAFVSFVIKGYSERQGLSLKRLFIVQALMVLMFILFSAPAIVSYTAILPYYQRGAGINLRGALQNSFHPTCIISFLFPSVPIKNPASYSTDLISRNTYFNILLLVCASCIFFLKKTSRDKFILAGIIFFFLFSLGDVIPLRSWCYKLLPLMDTFRHPSNARLFVIIGAIALGVTVYHKFTMGAVKRNYLVSICTILALFIAARLIMALSEVNLTSKISLAFSGNGDTRNALKMFFQNLTSNDHLVVNGIAQLLSLTLFIIFIRYEKTYLLSTLILLNSFLLAQFTIPYTLVSKIAPTAINDVLKNVPSGYLKPDTRKSLASDGVTSLASRSPLVMDEFYNKMIAAPDLVVTPTFINTMRTVYADSTTKREIFSRPFAYFNNTNTSFEVDKIWNNGFLFITANGLSSQLRLQQVYLPGWKCFIDGNRTDIGTYGPGLMSAAIPPGKHQVLFKYQPAGIVSAVLVSLISLLGCFVLSYKKM